MIRKIKVFRILPILVLLLGCSNDDTPSFESQFLGEWKLVEMRGSASPEPVTGADMDWQESYTFKADGSVLKQRERDGLNSTTNGVYERFIGNGMFPAIKIMYSVDNEIIGSCYDKEEYVYLESATQMRGEWEQCDGPGLIYTRD